MWSGFEGLNVVGGGELCNEGMLRKLGPTGSLTTHVSRVRDLLSLPLCVETRFDMHKQSSRCSIAVELVFQFRM